MSIFRQGGVVFALAALIAAQGCTEAGQETYRDRSIRETGYLQCDVAPNACGDNQMACMTDDQQVDCLEIPDQCDGRLRCDCVAELTCPDGACVEVNGGVQCVTDDNSGNNDNNGDPDPCQENPDDPDCGGVNNSGNNDGNNDNNGDECEQNPDDPGCVDNNNGEPCEDNPDDPNCQPQQGLYCLGLGDEQARVLDFGRTTLEEPTTRAFSFVNCSTDELLIGRYGLEVSDGHEVWFNDPEARAIQLVPGAIWTVQLSWAPYELSDLYGQLSLGSERTWDTFILAGRVDDRDGCDGDPDCGDYCQQHPWDPNCPGFLDYCRERPDEPACAEVFCRLFPEDPLCGDYCEANPGDPNCPYFFSYCQDTAEDPRCCQAFPALDYCGWDYCERFPEDPDCQEPAQEYCLQDAMTGDLGITFRQRPAQGALGQERFLLRNCGDEALSIASLGVTPVDGHDLQIGVGNLFRVRLLPGQEQAMTLYWRPLSEGDLQSDLSLTLTNGEQLWLPIYGPPATPDPVDVCFQGAEDGLYIQQEPAIGEEVQETLTLENCGQELLSFDGFEALTDGHDVELALNDAQEIAPGERLTVTLYWRPGHEGDLQVALRFRTERGELYTVNVYGRVRAGDPGPDPGEACLQGVDGRLRFQGSPRQTQVVEERFQLFNCGQETLNILEVWTEDDQRQLSVVSTNDLPTEIGPQDGFELTLRWLANGQEGDLFTQLFVTLDNGQVLDLTVEGSW